MMLMMMVPSIGAASEDPSAAAAAIPQLNLLDFISFYVEVYFMSFFCAFIDFLFVRPQTCGCILQSRIYISLKKLSDCLSLLHSTLYAQICHILFHICTIVVCG